MNAGVSSEKENVKESQSRSVIPSLDTPSGAGLGRHNNECHYGGMYNIYVKEFLLSMDTTPMVVLLCM